MAAHPTAIHLCSGYGGFELALRPWGVRTVAHVERDSYAASILMERMEQQRLDQAPIWDDLTTFDGEPWRGRVDIVTAGFPCQPFSTAATSIGARRGLDDDRWLWPAIATVVAQVRPRFVVLENVSPVIRQGLPVVLADLARLGFDAEWGLLAASNVGAPHRRQRWWCVAHTNGARCERGTEQTGNASSGRFVDRSKNVSFPPLRDDVAGWNKWIAKGGPEPVVRRDTDGPAAGLADALHLGGNGLVPQAATEAIRQLLARRGWKLKKC